jgi:alpha-amylase
MREELKSCVIGLALLAGAAGAFGQATVNPDVQGRAYRREGSKPAPTYGWWNDSVFYQVFVRSFQDSRSGPLANDGIGDIPGLIERLDYLNDGNPQTTTDLGVTALWLMPINPSPSYHGYDITDYFGIEPELGTMADFERLMAECHKRGIRVIMDLVLNHSSNRHPWFIEARDPKSPKHDWFVWANEKPNYLGPWNAPNWHPMVNTDGVTRWFYGLFWAGMPDLNYRNEELTRQMQEVIRFWLVEKKVDGYRLDAIRHLIEEGRQQDNTPDTHAWLQRFYTFYKGVKPDAYTIGEVWASAEDASQYVGDKLDAAFDFDLSTALMEGVMKGRAGKLTVALTENWSLFPHNQFGSFLQNHDQPRIMTQLLRPKGVERAEADAQMKLAATLQMLMPGVPYVYYGEEIGMVGDKPDPNIRTPMQWTAGTFAGFSTVRPWKPVNPDYPKINVEAQTGDPGSLLSLYRRLIALRMAEPAIRRGGLQVLEPAGDEKAVERVLAFVRTDPGERPSQGVLVVANVSAEPAQAVRIALPPGWRVAGGGESLLGGAGLPGVAGAGADIGPRGVVVMRIER